MERRRTKQQIHAPRFPDLGGNTWNSRTILVTPLEIPFAMRNFVSPRAAVGLTLECRGWYTRERSFLRGFQQ
jgi:hypothetical protein